MHEIFPDLWLLGREPPHGDTGYTYFLKGPDENILMGRSSDVSEYLSFIEEHGGVQAIYIHDRHMGKAGMGKTTELLGQGVICSAIEARACHKSVAIAEKLPMESALAASDLKIVPTPGHTQGALSHIWENGDHRYLFIGDTICPVDGEWQFWVSKKNTELMIESVENLRNEDFDVIIASSFVCKPFAWTVVTKRQKDNILSGVLAALSAR